MTQCTIVVEVCQQHHGKFANPVRNGKRLNNNSGFDLNTGGGFQRLPFFIDGKFIGISGRIREKPVVDRGLERALEQADWESWMPVLGDSQYQNQLLTVQNRPE
jgi:hypothetical protein